MKSKSKTLVLSALSISLTVGAASPAFAHPLRQPQSVEQQLEKAKRNEAKIKRQEIEKTIAEKTVRIETLQVALEKIEEQPTEIHPMIYIGATFLATAAPMMKFVDTNFVEENAIEMDEKTEQSVIEISEKIRALAKPGHEFSKPAYGYIFAAEYINWDEITPENRKAVINYVEQQAARLGDEDFAKVVNYAKTFTEETFAEVHRVPTTKVTDANALIRKIQKTALKSAIRKNRFIYAASAISFTVGSIASFFALKTESDDYEGTKIANEFESLVKYGKHDEAKALVEKVSAEYVALVAEVSALKAQLK
ncbi:hypothetical protein ACLVWU_10955 [Bdellovibrio sp. HCB290]|uniref:hypothetical protein n=1 Tax=Bdellovibrio sp. HCB290 TaxID=3394356 RepID=UPI0039B43E1B